MSLDTKFYVVTLEHSTKALMFGDEYNRLKNENKIIETLFHGTLSDLQDSKQNTLIKIISEIIQYPEALDSIVKHAKMLCDSANAN